MSGLLMAGMAVSTLVSMYGQAQQEQQQSANAQFNASVYEANARISRASAAFESARTREAGDKLLSEQGSYFAKAGVKFEGSVIETMANTAKQIELDLFAISFRARAEAMGYRGQASAALTSSLQAKKIAYINAALTAIQGGYDIYKESA